MSIRKAIIGLGILIFLVTAGTSDAMMMEGSLPLAGFSVTQNRANLALSTRITSSLTLVTGPGMGDYAPIPLFTNFGPHILDLSSIPNLIANFSLNNAVFGNFVATSAQIMDRTTNFLDISFMGIFTPGTGFAGFDPTETTLRISINQSAASLSEAITLNSVGDPLNPVPEPGTWALLVTGIAGLFGYSWRRRQRG